VTTKLEFLAKHTIFADLDDAELLALSQIAEECDFGEGSVIAYQRDVADGITIVKSGRLHSKEVDQHGRVRDANTRQFAENDFFGAEWLFETGTQPATVTGTHEGRIIIIKGEDFRRFLISYPDAVHNLEPIIDEEGHRYSGLPEEAWERANKLPLTERREHIGPIRLLPDELVEYYSRRSTIVLVTSLLWPVMGLILVPMLAYFLISNSNVAYGTLRAGIIVVSIAFFGAITIFRLLDWRNDYFVITNKHISHREFELRSFRTQLNKVPVGEVQSVTVERPTLTANLFNVGTVRITTASVVGTILFDGIDNPLEVEEILDKLRKRVQFTDAALAQTTMRNSVERHFGIEPGVTPVVDENEIVDEDLFLPAEQRSVWYALTRWVNWRVEENGVITYRRNYFILFWDILLPVLVLAVILVIGGLLYRSLDTDLINIVAVLTPFILISLFWLVWRYEDWRNDKFQLTQLDVIDIDRKPFGFGESRKQAPLSNIQNVTAERPGFFATVFDYGNVHIETAGAEAEILFDKIPRPSRVLTDIFRRLEENREQQRRREGETRREEYAVLLDVYKQELERDLIPRRTPD
jgi:membrane protein YdbS with pleckstrin-like domain/CRP-like cAMP-binding protein